MLATWVLTSQEVRCGVVFGEMFLIPCIAFRSGEWWWSEYSLTLWVVRENHDGTMQTWWRRTPLFSKELQFLLFLPFLQSPPQSPWPSKGDVSALLLQTICFPWALFSFLFWDHSRSVVSSHDALFLNNDTLQNYVQCHNQVTGIGTTRQSQVAPHFHRNVFVYFCAVLSAVWIHVLPPQSSFQSSPLVPHPCPPHQPLTTVILLL